MTSENPIIWVPGFFANLSQRPLQTEPPRAPVLPVQQRHDFRLRNEIVFPPFLNDLDHAGVLQGLADDLTIHERTAELESALRTLKAAMAAVEGLLR